MSAAHTPGPWVVEEGPHWLTVCREDAPFTDGKRDPVVGTRWSGAVTDAERANARLIATAPELLAQLEYAVKLFGAWPMLNGTAQVQSMRNTIAKALGRTPNEIGDGCE